MKTVTDETGLCHFWGESNLIFLCITKKIVGFMLNRSIFVLGKGKYGKRVHVLVGQPSDGLWWIFAMYVVDP